MPRIDIDESSPAKSVTFARTLLRSAVGLILIGHGAQKLAQLAAFSGELSTRFGLSGADAHVLAYAAAGIELAAGAGLILGWFTRFSAFVLVCASAWGFALEFAQGGSVLRVSPGLELAVVLVCVGTLFMFTGGGALSLDAALRERRWRKAIENDAIWSRPEYVGPGRHAAD